MQTYYNTLFCPSKHEHDYSFLGLKMNLFFFFLQHPQLSSTVIFYSLCSGVVVFAIHYTVAETINDWPGYIRQFYLWSWGKAQQGESIIGKKTKEGRASPAHASPPSGALRLACQRSRINPLPGKPAKIIGYNHMWQPAHDPVTCGAPAPALCNHGRLSQFGSKSR